MGLRSPALTAPRAPCGCLRQHDIQQVQRLHEVALFIQFLLRPGHDRAAGLTGQLDQILHAQSERGAAYSSVVDSCMNHPA